MSFKTLTRAGGVLSAALAMVALGGAPADATINGLKSAELGTTFSFATGTDYLSFADGGSVPFWGFANTTDMSAAVSSLSPPSGQVQYPGPTLIVNEGETITINLTNNLPEPVSMMFPGLGGPSEPVFEGGVRAGLRSLAHETAPGGTGTYTFTASRPGTFYYQSGTNIAKQTYMGLFGVIVVRPAGYEEYNEAGNDQWTRESAAIPGSSAAEEAKLTRHAYGVGDPDNGGDADSIASRYQREYMEVYHEIDPRINDAVAAGLDWDLSDYHPVYWTINGRSMPDNLWPDFTPWLPTQPYGSLHLSHPAERSFVRFMNFGRDPHPQHLHTDDILLMGHDGHMFHSAPNTGAEYGQFINTLNSLPGQTYDGVWVYTGAGLGWDIYGHADADNGIAGGAACNPADLSQLAPFEDPAEHCKPFPVTLPDPNNQTFGGFWSGSPFLGNAGDLPPGEAGLNPWNGYVAIWHSHAEIELTNNNIFPGGILGFMIVVPYDDGTGAIPAIGY